ncbi:formate dehydrogenase accessory protein FdhE [Roseateles depolymerans]|uniref:Protein FdhE homolog n=1 Tax=Roseateles depolymerans TaxID=76731 RepID=A0A0U3D2U4_9BURK|nr:formate dehydrogenase accessory protein FdhE [Roseateles depolymerans]ALV07910.1 FdhE-like protein [Roseateles depolymerans]REG21869.1 Tat proofreading chaperone FdhE [Roseateles depolymerans]
MTATSNTGNAGGTGETGKTVSSQIRLMTPEEIAVNAGARPAPLRLPEAGVFAERALRLRQLAQDHPMRDYLLFAAEVAQRQHEQLKQARPLTLPNESDLAEAMAAGQPPLDSRTFARQSAWRDELKNLLQALVTAAVPAPVQALAKDLMQWDEATLERQAHALLSGGGPGLDPAAAPLLAAALQLHWVRLVQQLQDRYQRAGKTEHLAPFGLIDDPTVCPCCGSRPVASITRIAAEMSGQRFLACSLCATQWHYVRIKCTHCQSTKGISFRQLVDDDGKLPNEAVQAECCETCGHYLKQVHMEKDLQVEPLADDLASLTLDLLVGDLGLVRHGFNPLLILGEPDAGDDRPPGDDTQAPGPAHSGAAPPDPGGH